MEIKNNVDPKILWLTEERCISREVALAAGVSFRNIGFGNEVVIPVRYQDGRLLFNKYRRDPILTTGPKYRYEGGNSASIFGLETISNLPENTQVIVTEGELDALALRTLGYIAVSSTGGAGTWRPEWVRHFEGLETVFLYDADKAGIEGMLRAASNIPNAKIAWVPVEFGKDPTDVIYSGNEDALKQAIAEAARYDIPSGEEDEAGRLKKLENLRITLRNESMVLNQAREKTPFHRDIALKWVELELERLKREASRDRRNGTSADDSKISQAKTYSIYELVDVNHDGFAQCVYHVEKTRSMKVYKDGHAFSFCCGRRSDAIDIYMALESCDFLYAISALARKV